MFLVMAGTLAIASPVAAAPATLEGTVTGGGQLLEGASVSVLTIPTGEVVASAVTNAQGEFLISIDSGTYDIEVRGPDGSTFATGRLTSQPIEGSTFRSLVLVPGPPPPVRGLSGSFVGFDGGLLPLVSGSLFIADDTAMLMASLPVDPVTGVVEGTPAPGVYTRLFLSGSMRPEVAGEQSRYSMSAMQSFEVGSGTVLAPIVFPEKKVLTVVLRDASGVPVTGSVRVESLRTGLSVPGYSAEWSASLSASGTGSDVQLDAFATGTATVRIQFDGNPNAAVTTVDLSRVSSVFAFSTTGQVVTSTPPPPPTGVSVTVGDRSATITWLRPASDGGSPIIGYTVTATPGGQTCSTDSADALSCTITGLTNGVSYTFVVTARNAVGPSTPSVPPLDQSGNPTPVTVGTPPGPVTVLPPTIDPGDGTTATISWLAAASDPNLPVIGYVATASPGGQFCSTTGALSCTITGLDPTVSYSFTVVAINGVGPSPVARPDAPTAVVAAQGSYRQAIVSWTAPANNGGSPITAYTVTASDGGGSCAPATTSCSIGGLTPGATYTFTVTATNAQGVSVPSASSNPLQVGLDVTGPSVTASVSPASPDGSNGWYRTRPTVSFVCSDAESGVADCPASVQPADGGGQVITRTATDVAGNSSSTSVTLSVDTVAPTVSVSRSATGELSCTASDATSGVAGSCSVGTPVEVSPGTFSVSATAIDEAGNAGAGSLTFTVAATSDRALVQSWISRLVGMQLSGREASARSEAVDVLRDVAEAENWTSAGRIRLSEGADALEELADVVRELGRITSSPVAGQVSEEIVVMSRRWVDEVLASAPARGVSADRIAQAQQALAQGDQHRAQGRLAQAVEAYSRAFDRVTDD